MKYIIRKSLVHKYYKREGVKGNYKYYYTKDEYQKEHKGEESDIKLNIKRKDLTIIVKNGDEKIGQIFLAKGKTDNGEKLLLIERGDVEEKYQRKGVYSKMIDFIIANLKDNEKLVSMGRSQDAAKFWQKRLDLYDWQAGIDEEKDQQDYAIVLDKNGHKLVDVSDLNYIDWN